MSLRTLVSSLLVFLSLTSLGPVARAELPSAPKASPAGPPAPLRLASRDDEEALDEPAVQRGDSERPRYGRPVRRGPSKGLLIGGIVTLAASYSLSALVGLQLVAKEGDPECYASNCGTVGGRLIIPVIGPWLALSASPTDGGKTVSALLGIAQGTGLILTILGIQRYADTQPRSRYAFTDGLTFGFVQAPGGGSFQLAGAL